MSLRLELELSRATVAKCVGISESLLRHAENGAVIVWQDDEWTDLALRLAAFHGLSPDEIWNEGEIARRELEGRPSREGM